MAKISMVEREKRRAQLSKKFNKKRKELKVLISHPDTNQDERMDAVIALQNLPRDSSRCRQRSRCRLCGRSRAYNRLTGLCRIHMRYAVLNGLVPGMHKASW